MICNRPVIAIYPRIHVYELPMIKALSFSSSHVQEGDFIRVEKNTETDWIWDWSSRPDQTPPKLVFSC